MKIARVEWQTLALLALTYGVWGWALHWGYGLSSIVGIVVAGLAIAQFSSLQHEALHGHPFRIRWLNEALTTPALSLTVPYGRFRDTHLAHHHDPALTDPYDDPESNFFAPAVWARLPGWARRLLAANNTLLGRMLLGPMVGTVMWLRGEARLIAQNAPGVRRDWALHALGLVPVVAWVWLAAMPWWGYVLAAYLGHAMLRIRTFLEHRAHVDPAGRTVVVEDRGPLSILFLNNNFHAVHHAHPGVPWYRLPALYAANRAAVLAGNDGYVYRSYGTVFARYFLRAKDPLVHPLYPAEKP
jgi:fatty acid desaturase